jgi:hypothetical protein
MISKYILREEKGRKEWVRKGSEELRRTGSPRLNLNKM